jgi:hypothetical protein
LGCGGGAAIPLPLYADIEMVNEWLTRGPIGFQNARSPENSKKVSLREVGRRATAQLLQLSFGQSAKVSHIRTVCDFAHIIGGRFDRIFRK